MDNDFDPQGQQNNYPQPIIIEQPKKKRSALGTMWMVFKTFVFLGMIFIFLAILSVIVVALGGGKDLVIEQVLVKGPARSKIVVVNLNGIIMNGAAKDITKQLNAIRKDDDVKGVILKVNSPGGGVAASDRIYNEIKLFRDNTSIPVVAFMQGVAASGGYYTSVACDKIIAEPTTITGSIGVIVEYFVVQDLLESKLGIEPIVVKSGEHKDWGTNPFHKPTPEEIEYLQKKLISPAYERFVDIIDESRDNLNAQQVRDLADGSIYSADEALDNGLIDEIGYFKEALQLIKNRAGVIDALVVEYVKPLGFVDLMQMKAQSSFKLDRQTLRELSRTELMYLWNVN